MLFDDSEDKKNFRVEWVDNKGKKHRTTLFGKFVSATEASDYIRDNRKTCVGTPYAYWI